MSKTSQQYSESLMGSVRGLGKLIDHRGCLDTIARLTRERDEACAVRDNLRVALVAVIGVNRTAAVEKLGYRAGKKGEAA